MGTTAEKLQKLISTKAAIKTSLENKGLTPTDKFDTYPALIDSISGGGSGDVDIDFIASENINAGDKVYLQIMPQVQFDGNSYLKVAANTYYSANSTNTGKYYYYDGTSLSYISETIEAVKFLGKDIDNCFVVNSTSISYRSNIKTTISTIYSFQSGYTIGSVHIYSITRTKYIIVIGEYKKVNYGYTLYGIAYLVTLSDDLSSVLSNERIQSDGGTPLATTSQSYLFKITDKKYVISFAVNGASSGLAYYVARSMYEVVFADDYSTFTATKITSISAPIVHNIISSTYGVTRYSADCEGNCFINSGILYYKNESITKKATSIPSIGLAQCIAQYSDNKIYVKKFSIVKNPVSDVQTNGYNNYTFIGTYYQSDPIQYLIILSNVVKSGGIFVGYAKTSATAGNNVTVSMVADYILDTEDVQ